mmetsp:Transcript_128546/g.222054  ORF Transcript_128546/g.222054 Transcript_128546/m.222054 type:complete len:93 (-) Transcript_128546:258-536(-)
MPDADKRMHASRTSVDILHSGGHWKVALLGIEYPTQSQRKAGQVATFSWRNTLTCMYLTASLAQRSSRLASVSPQPEKTASKGSHSVHPLLT